MTDLTNFTDTSDVSDAAIDRLVRLELAKEGWRRDDIGYSAALTAAKRLYLMGIEKGKGA